LESLSFSLQVVKHEALSLSSDVGDSACQWGRLFEEFSILAQRVEFSNEVRNVHGNVELVWLRVSIRWFLKFIDHVRSIFIILGWVKNDLFLLILLLFGVLFDLLFGLLFSFLSGESFLFF
jgi:hypothetical protein